MIKNRIGFSFATPIIIAGVVISIAGFAATIETPLLGVVLALGSMFLWTSSYGIEIDIQQNRFREYGSMYGIKKGEWKSLDKVPFITVLRGRTGMTVYSRSNRATSDIDDRYEVYLLNQSHRAKILVQRFDSKKQALTYAEKLAVKLEKKIVQYSPAVSEKTQSRRRTR